MDANRHRAEHEISRGEALLDNGIDIALQGNKIVHQRALFLRIGHNSLAGLLHAAIGNMMTTNQYNTHFNVLREAGLQRW